MTARKRQVGPVDPGPQSSAVVKREGRSRGRNVTGPRLMLLSRLGELLVFSDALAFRLLFCLRRALCAPGPVSSRFRQQGDLRS